MNKKPFEIIYTSTQVQEAVNDIAQDIVAWVGGLPVRALNLVSVLEGARPFTRDLTARLEELLPGLELTIHEVRIKGTDGTTLLKDRQWQEGRLDRQDIQKHPVLIVDDLVDSGLTLETLRRELASLGAEEIKTAVLIRKYGQTGGRVDFCGFELDLNPEAL